MDASSVSTVAASVIAALAFSVGLWQFGKTQQATRLNLELQSNLLKHEREAKAIELFVHFSQLKQETSTRALTPQDFWHHNAMIALTESIHKIIGEDYEWQKTVVWMINTQKPFLLSNKIDRSTYVASFAKIVQDTVPDVRWV